MNRTRLIAIHLPQFHPFKENDEWWGKGFTEWSNVVKAKPRFKGHYQPHLPADTGFYDLRLPEARKMQSDLAKEYGIYGFCYYHYWFNGKRLMEKPVDEIVASGKPDFPFMLCWANENWSRNWDGGFSKMLIEQNYCEKDYENHMRLLCEKFFIDKRYIKINGKPFFTIYNPKKLPDAKVCVDIWRKTAREYGFELYLGYMTRMDDDFIKDGFDVSIDFQPHIQRSMKTGVIPQIIDWKNSNILRRCYEKIFPKSDNPFNLNYDYGNYVDYICSKPKPSLKQFPGITPSWDNSPRRKGWFFMMKNSTPSLYGKWLSNILKKFKPYSDEENFVFINAWNEWAEGNHLEPDQKWGRGYLEETKKAIESYYNEKKRNDDIVLFLTACINPGGMGMTVLQDSDQRKRQYIEAIRWYLDNTNVKMVVSENTCYDLTPEFRSQIESGRLEYLTYDGNDYDKSKGKGYGEAMIIDYGLKQSKLIGDSTLIIKITGRLKCHSINTIIKRCNKENTIYSSYTKDGKGNTISNSQVFVFNRYFWKYYYAPLIENINDCEGVFFEHILYAAINNWKNEGNRFDNFWFPLNISGVSGTSGKPISTHSSRIIIWLHYFLHLLGYNGSLRFWKKE